MPKENDCGFLEEQIFPSGSRTVCVDPESCLWGWEDFKAMLCDFAENSPNEKIYIDSRIIPGFMGSSRYITEECRSVMSDVLENAPYEKYDVRYNAIVSMSWKDREQLRKKWKKPILQEIGNLTFVNRDWQR